MRPQLRDLIEEAYEIFGGYRIGHLARPRMRDHRSLLDGLMLASLERVDLVHWPARGALAFDLADVLTLRYRARRSRSCAGGIAAVHMAVLHTDVIYQTSRTYSHSAYLEDHSEATDRIGAFLRRPDIPRIETSFFKVEDPRLQQLL